jgi:serine/threonine-protein kinase RsbW
MIAQAQLHVTSRADLQAPRPLRHVLTSLLMALNVEDPRRSDIILAVGEALSNAVEHAYAGREAGTVELKAQTNEERTLVVEVADRGHFIERTGSPDRGFGLRIVRNIARDVVVNNDDGTRVTMTFDLAS